jgi:hypothetical protein
LLSDNWTPSEAINQSQATNLIEVICQGSRMTFVVNGQQLAQVEDDRFTHGDIALYAGSFYQGGVQVNFDNLRVTAP